MNCEEKLHIEVKEGLCIAVWLEGREEKQREFMNRDLALAFALEMSMNPPRSVDVHYTLSVEDQNGRPGLTPVVMTCRFDDGAYFIW